MNETCTGVRQRLEVGATATDADLAAHLQTCEGCRSHAAILAVLGRLEPQADPDAVRSIMAALPPAPWQRRRVAFWLPLAAGLGLVAAGLALLGGVPAPTAVAGLPAAVAAVLGWIVSSALDTLAAAHAGSDAVRVALAAGGLWLVIWLALAALGGSWAVVSLVARVRTGRQE